MSETELYVRIVHTPDRSVEGYFISQVNEYLWDLDVLLIKVQDNLYQVFESTVLPVPEGFTSKRCDIIREALGEALTDMQDETGVRAGIIIKSTGYDNSMPV